MQMNKLDKGAVKLWYIRSGAGAGIRSSGICAICRNHDAALLSCTVRRSTGKLHPPRRTEPLRFWRCG